MSHLTNANAFLAGLKKSLHHNQHMQSSNRTSPTVHRPITNNNNTNIHNNINKPTSTNNKNNKNENELIIEAYQRYYKEKKIQPSNPYHLISYAKNIIGLNIKYSIANKFIKQSKSILNELIANIKFEKEETEENCHTTDNKENNNTNNNNNNNNNSSININKKISLKSDVCQICCFEKENIITINKCKHEFCKDCLVKYIKSSNNKLNISCPCCSSKLEQFSDIKLALSHTEYFNIYLSPNIQQSCLTPNCNQKYLFGSTTAKYDCLSCHQSWCIFCKVKWHSNMDCLTFRATDNTYKKSCIEILNNCSTKEISGIQNVPEMRYCVNCKMVIQHTVGCLHMTCFCGYQFCFICLQPWNGHNYNQCVLVPRQGITDL